MFNTQQDFIDAYRKDNIPPSNYHGDVNPFDGFVYAALCNTLSSIENVTNQRIANLRTFRNNDKVLQQDWKEIIKSLSDEEFVFYLKDSCLSKGTKDKIETQINDLKHYTETAINKYNASENFWYVTKGDAGLEEYEKLSRFNDLFGVYSKEVTVEVRSYFNSCLSTFHDRVVRNPYTEYAKVNLSIQAKEMIRNLYLSKEYPCDTTEDMELLLRNLDFTLNVKS